MEAGFEVVVACESKLTKKRIEKKLKQDKPREKTVVIEAGKLLEKSLTQFITFTSSSSSTLQSSGTG